MATIEFVEWPYSSATFAATVSSRKIEASRVELDKVFESSDDNFPLWGHNFWWPDDFDFVIYTNGDNAAFVAGDLQHIESLFGLSFQYCLARFVDANSAHPGWVTLVKPFQHFCLEVKKG